MSGDRSPLPYPGCSAEKCHLPEPQSEDEIAIPATNAPLG